MILFCPMDHNLLELVDQDSGLKYACKTCPYIFHVNQKLSWQHQVESGLKRAEEVVGSEDALKNAATTKEQCPKCTNDVAYFREFQTRSADEPATIFYRCTKCAHQWKE